MTDWRDSKDTEAKQAQPADAFRADPRIKDLVRLLARRAAEADYERFLKANEELRHNPDERLET